MKIKNLAIAFIYIYCINLFEVQAKDNHLNNLNNESQKNLIIAKSLEGESYILGAGDTIDIKFYFAPTN